MANFRILTSWLLAIVLISGCSLLPKQKDETKDWTASKFYAEASAALKEGDYEQAIKYYEGLEARFPFGRYAMQAQLDVAYAYYKYEEPDSAIAALDRFIKLHPRNPHVAYAHYLKGIVNFNRSLGFLERFVPGDSSQRDPGSALDSFKDFSELVEKFPDSEYAADARKRLIYLRNNLARHEIHVARYYLERGAYVAAANRCVYVLEKYQRTPAVRDALEIMIQAYNKLGLDQLAADAQRVLALNEAEGHFDYLKPSPEDQKSTVEQVWDYLELDQN